MKEFSGCHLTTYARKSCIFIMRSYTLSLMIDFSFFDRVDICKVRTNWNEIRMLGLLPPHAKQNYVYMSMMDISETTEVVVTLFQQGCRLVKTWLNCQRVYWGFGTFRFLIVALIVLGSFHSNLIEIEKVSAERCTCGWHFS